MLPHWDETAQIVRLFHWLRERTAEMFLRIRAWRIAVRYIAF
jgi:hypothetical protein